MTGNEIEELMRKHNKIVEIRARRDAAKIFIGQVNKWQDGNRMMIVFGRNDDRKLELPYGLKPVLIDCMMKFCRDLEHETEKALERL